jgi:hypothetical protein
MILFEIDFTCRAGNQGEPMKNNHRSLSFSESFSLPVSLPTPSLGFQVLVAGLFLFALVPIFGATSAGASDLGNSFVKTPIGSDPGQPDGRDGGETIADAFIISGLPFTDTGNTSDNVDDYSEDCPYSGSVAPDVVYVFTPDVSGPIDIDLCESGYDTKVFVYETVATPGAPYACNDDALCELSFRSALDGLDVTAGNAYYIIIDGYGEEMGDYLLTISTSPPPCELDCPDNGVPEGEPELVDGYIDSYNGGCNWDPYVFQLLENPVICGVSGWYSIDEVSYRDTDFYDLDVSSLPGGFITCQSEYDTHLYVLIPDCGVISPILYDAYCECEGYGWIEFVLPGFDHVWIFVGPTVFSGPVNEFDYVLTVDLWTVAVEESSWGKIKTRFRQ